MSYSKHHIDHKREERTCAICKTVKHFSQYNAFWQRGYKATRPECKPCHSFLVAQKQQEKLMEKAPHNYYQCEDEECNKIWSKSRGTICPNCGGL
jgi:hypothetical protein